jgi:predicted nucleic acid-binding protein
MPTTKREAGLRRHERFARLVADDRNHANAKGLFQRAEQERWRLVTTNAVVTEAYALMLVRAREGRAKAIEFLDGLSGSRVRIERVRASDEVRAVALVRRYRDKSYTLCDAW